MRPLPLEANTLSSFYPGAGRIGAFRHQPGLDPSHAEDWIASTTPRTGAAPLGLTTLPDGSLLADRFAAEPLSWFGPEYTARDIAAAELSGWVARQDTEALLANCNRVSVSAGDVIFCPGSMPHAIGTGILMLEIQEMTDFSIMLEWAGFPLDPDGLFLGLDQDVALSAVRREAVAGQDLEALRGQ
ncbi:MAG TPA: hypothetical protein VMC83_31870, partial [Streptosporangiaceae bacterium]|nr:hypothetical protein [Streptosporangiaceae bacterium]